MDCRKFSGSCSVGIRFVSIWHPHIKVHQFEISRERLRPDSEIGPDEPLKRRICLSSKNPEVSALLFMAPRPIYAEGIYLPEDNSRINLVILAICQLVIPALPVFYLEGKFFPLIDSAVKAALVDFFATHLVAVDENGKLVEDEYRPDKFSPKYRPAPFNLSRWLKFPKGPDSPIVRSVRQINVSAEFCNRLKESGKTELLAQLERLGPLPSTKELNGRAGSRIGDGLIPTTGWGLLNLQVVVWEPHPDSRELAQALLAEEIQSRLAAGIRQTAAGERDDIRARAEGESARYSALVEALTDNGVSPNIAAEVVRTQVGMEQLHGAGVSTFVLGSGGQTGIQAGIMIPPQPPPSSKTE